MCFFKILRGFLFSIISEKKIQFLKASLIFLAIRESVIRLIQEKEFVAFLDGDRAGDLISKEIQQVGKVKEIIRAPTGKEVEDLTPSEIQEIKNLQTEMNRIIF